MAGLGIKEEAAVGRIAALLANFVTNDIVDRAAAEFGFRRLTESSKSKKLRGMLRELLSDGRSLSTAGRLLERVVLEAYHRTVSGLVTMTNEDVDVLVAQMRVAGIPTGDLARSNWRTGLKKAAAVPEARPSTAPQTAASKASARRHDEALLYMGELSAGVMSPQRRGREVEKVAAEVLRVEGLGGVHNIVNPGEQIDVAFVLDGGHYLLESKWENSPEGLPALRDFSEKVRRKAEGTFGVLLSMSGFVRNINATAAQGTRLNCIGITHREFMSVLEGRVTFGEIVRVARASASRRSLFYAEG